MNMVEGVPIRDAFEVEPLVRRQLEHGTVWNHRSDVTDLDGLSRAASAGGALRPAFALAVAHLLEDDDRSVRTGAAAALPGLRDAMGVAHLAMVLDTRPELFEGVKPEKFEVSPHEDLAGAVFAAVAAQVLDEPDPPGEQVVRVLRRGAVAGRWVLPALAKVDPDWLLDNASEVVPRVSVGGILQNLATPEQRRRLLEALAPWPRDAAETQLAWTYWRHLPAAEVPELRAILERR